MKRKYVVIAFVFMILCVSMTRLADASYTILKTDATNYNYADHDGSIYGYSTITHSTTTGQETVLGATPWYGGLHTCRLDMWISFTAAENGAVYASAKWSMSYKLEAGTNSGAYAKLWVYYVLYNSDKSYIEQSSSVFSDSAVSGGGLIIREGIINENHEHSRLFASSLNQGSSYWVSVRLYMEVNGVYGHIHAKGSSSALTMDINEIKVYR